MSTTFPDKPLAITCGDPAGVGLEIIHRWASENPGKAAHCAFLGPQQWARGLPGTIVPLWPADYVGTPGVPDKAGARIALAALEEAAIGTVQGRYSGVVTAPISKDCMRQIGFPFPGHTEFFAARWGGEPSMGFVGERLRLVLATWHIPLMSVAKALNEETITRAVERAASLAVAYSSEETPRIAVCGLNPHAGENGLLGSEERDFIDPLLEGLRERFPGLSKALPPDTVFQRQLAGDFDVSVALYHDQGLGPLKTLEFDSAVNVTLGLPHLRTSPDHGTAFGIAGKGLASPRSFAHAVDVALRLLGSAQ